MVSQGEAGRPLTILYRYDVAHHFTAFHAGRIPTRFTSSRTGCHLSHPAENINESYCCIQTLTISAVFFIGWTATSDKADSGMPHDLNVYPRCVGWRFTTRHHGKLQSFETCLMVVSLTFFLPFIIKFFHIAIY